MPTSIERLEKIVGFDPARGNSPGADVLAEALKEVKEERQKVSKEVAKQLLIKLIDLRSQMAAKKRDFDSQYKKSEKEMGKMLNKLEAMASGKTLEEAEQEEKNSDDKQSSEEQG